MYSPLTKTQAIPYRNNARGRRPEFKFIAWRTVFGKCDMSSIINSLAVSRNFPFTNLHNRIYLQPIRHLDRNVEDNLLRVIKALTC